MGELLSAFAQAFDASAALALPAALLWGVLSVVLSPCHLSSVPLVVAYMNGGTEFPTGRRALLISTSFAVGILGSIAVIGVVTAAAGRMAGDVGRWGTFGLAAVFFAVGLHLLGVLPLPTWTTPMARTGRRGPAGALVLGLVFGAALGPCTFAFMAPLLGLAFRSGAGEAAYGVLLVAAYGLGHGAAIVAAGASAGSVQRWLAWKKGERAARVLRAAAGLTVIAGGIYFLYTAV
ncbi:MAG: cytochrome c biogenesis protein CcdA [Anaeromyxobacteraceae bacterium]